MSDSGDLLGWALAYATRGWPVLPLRPRSKLPATEHGFKDASIDPDVIQRWWTLQPLCNVGLRTGVAFDGLDLDGEDALDELDRAGYEATGQELCGAIVGPCVLTGRSGGVHIYVQPTGRKNATAIRPGIDWRGDGGYLVAPPSVHPNGGVYEWGAVDGIDTPLEPVPEWFLRVWDQKGTTNSATGRTSLLNELEREVGRGSRYGIKALESELGRLAMAPIGERNHALNRSAYSAGQLIAGRELDSMFAVAELLVVASRIGLSDSESEATIKSGIGAGMTKPRSAR